MSQTENTTHPSRQTMEGLRYARWAGNFLGILLIGIAIKNFSSGSMDTLTVIQSVYYILYGCLLNVRLTNLPNSLWNKVFAALVALSVLFVFLMIATVMFAYMAAADRGERLGVPGFEGTLIFLALMQVPVALFQRKPDMLD